jgi:hypothetical protein
MYMSCTRSKIIDQARSWIGLNEADGSHKKIVDIYNSQDKLPRNYKLKLTDSWCAGTVSALAIACGATDIIPVEVSCGKLIEIAKAMGIWVEADNHIPAPGDLILYDWGDNGKGDNTGWPDHVGICEYVVGDSITVIEGNFQNAVGRRLIKVNGKYIRGYITPHYDAEPVKPVEAEKECTVKLKVLKRGSKGKAVKALQHLLMAYGCNCGGYGADGSFGTGTENALRSYQETHGLTADGVCGPATWAKLLGVSV